MGAEELLRSLNQRNDGFRRAPWGSHSGSRLGPGSLGRGMSPESERRGGESRGVVRHGGIVGGEDVWEGDRSSKILSTVSCYTLVTSLLKTQVTLVS